MLLRSSPASPYGRKVRIALALLGLGDRVRVEDTDTMAEGDAIRRQNPLGKIPALVLDDGVCLYDSRVILEYLDHLAGGGRIIPAGAARFPALTGQALADGLLDAALLQVYEGRWRAEAHRDERWVAHQEGKVVRALIAIEATPSRIDVLPDVGCIATACALGYLDLRFEGRWREGRAGLVAWLDDFSARVPAYEETRMRT